MCHCEVCKILQIGDSLKYCININILLKQQQFILYYTLWNIIPKSSYLIMLSYYIKNM